MTSTLRRGISSLIRTTSAADNPEAGQRSLIAKSDGWYDRDSSGVETNLNLSGSGGGGVEGALPTEFSTGQPSTPATGLKLFVRTRARRMLSMIGPTGQVTQLQPHLGFNKTAWINTASGVATLSSNGLVAANVSTPTGVVTVASSFFGSVVRARYTTAATAGAGNGMRATGTPFFLSTTQNMGGFHAVFRFGVSASTATSRVFVGFLTQGGAMNAATDPSVLNQTIGVGNDSADTNLSIMYNDTTGTATKIDLGANFPAKTANTWFYELSLFSPAGGGQQVWWAIRRLNDDLTVQSSGPVTADLPSLNVGLSPHAHISNGTTATAASIDVQSIYVESDN